MLKELLNKNKQDVYCIFILITIFTICSVISWGTFGALYYDCGREAILPQWILEGKVLFKDIFGMYTPLSYYFNAVLYKFFGNSLTTLQVAASINSLIIIITIYSILRQFTGKLYSITLSIFLMTFYIFRSVRVINFLLPYSFAMIYALSTMLISLLFGLLYAKYYKKFLIYIAFLMLGISVANKPEFLLCAIPLIFITIISRQNSFKLWVLNILIFFIPSVLTITALFSQGFNMEDLNNYHRFLVNFFNTPEQKFFTQNSIAASINTHNILVQLQSLFNSIITLIIPLTIFKTISIKRFRILGILGLFLLLPFFIIVTHNQTLSSHEQLGWIMYLLIPITILSIKNKDTKLLFLCSFAIFATARIKFNIVYHGMSVFFILLPITAVWAYITSKYEHLICEKLKIRIPLTLSIILIGIVSCSFNFYIKNYYFVKINTNGKGYLKSDRAIAEPFNNTTEWIVKNTKPTDRVVVLPEGPMINYITERPTLPKYYHLIPNHIAALNENDIVNGLSGNLPEYFVLVNVNYKSYDKPYICEDFGFEICNLVENNYTQKAEFTEISTKADKHTLKIYKRNKN